jgi:spore coat polysaccharide biosynthesis protein SpsF
LLKVVGIVQARMGSERLPGKSLALIEGRPMLEYVLRRVMGSKRISESWLATTALPEDDPLCLVAERLGLPCYRGSEENVLARYYETALIARAEIVVRLTADNPLIDPEFVDWVIEEFFSSHPSVDYIDTVVSNTFPYGLAVEVFSFDALKKAWLESTEDFDKEHVTAFIRKNSERFRQKHLVSTENNSDLRWTVDNLQDLEKMRLIYSEFGLDHRMTSHKKIIARLRSLPLSLNKGVGRV